MSGTTLADKRSSVCPKVYTISQEALSPKQMAQVFGFSAVSLWLFLSKRCVATRIRRKHSCENVLQSLPVVNSFFLLQQGQGRHHGDLIWDATVKQSRGVVLANLIWSLLSRQLFITFHAGMFIVPQLMCVAVTACLAVFLVFPLCWVNLQKHGPERLVLGTGRTGMSQPFSFAPLFAFFLLLAYSPACVTEAGSPQRYSTSGALA